ncbi:MAG: hypothetical protein C0506_11760 [Anaerolinea sp.]|nr:hypothetical protein [Anaerolinea sp.]
MAIRKLVRAEVAARETGSSLEEIQRQVERGETEGFVCEGELLVPDDAATPEVDERLASVEWLRRWAREAGVGEGPLSAAELVREDREEHERQLWPKH